MRIIDDHVHIGKNRQTKYCTFIEVWRDLHAAAADGACLFAFPEDMYRRMAQTEAWIQANAYVSEAANTSRDLYPFYFV